jgi:hypothetical protein
MDLTVRDEAMEEYNNMNIYLLELHFDHGSRYINVRGTDIVDALTTAQMIYPNMLVTIPVEWEEAI